MIKKFIIILIIFALILAGLQLFGGRDFGQITVAWDKYQQTGELSTLMSDVGVMFKGGKVREGRLPSSVYAERVMYRWTDELGVVHVGERAPENYEYETIKLGELNFEVEEGMSDEEIKDILAKGNQ